MLNNLQERSAPGTAPAAPENPRPRKPAVLVVDDDPEVLLVTKDMLFQLGFLATTASDGHEALQICSLGLTDLVLTDLVMPGQEGIETILMIREKFPGMPIVAMSGGFAASRNYLNLAKQAGAATVILKPFTLDDLRHEINSALPFELQVRRA
ncbi:MAG TPA: response regulator [Verrucomicrobiae bacterium]|nr:response regulator [Verrucomicrobiae bacterium]